VNAGTGQILASTLTTNNVDDASQIGPLLDKIHDPIASFTGGWQRRSGHSKRALGRSPTGCVRTDERRAIEVSVAVGYRIHYCYT
jgi:hypothetical protein